MKLTCFETFLVTTVFALFVCLFFDIAFSNVIRVSVFEAFAQKFGYFRGLMGSPKECSTSVARDSTVVYVLLFTLRSFNIR